MTRLEKVYTQPFPDGAEKIHWNSKKSEHAPGPTTVPGALDNVDFMVKDSKRFADSGGWSMAALAAKYGDRYGGVPPRVLLEDTQTTRPLPCLR